MNINVTKYKRYIKISRNDVDGAYIQPIEEIANAVDGELDSGESGLRVTLEVIFMSEDEYKSLPEFKGW